MPFFEDNWFFASFLIISLTRNNAEHLRRSVYNVVAKFFIGNDLMTI
jgi:hypothetical protein